MFGVLSVNTNYSSKTKVHGVQYRFQSRINMKLMNANISLNREPQNNDHIYYLRYKVLLYMVNIIIQKIALLLFTSRT